MKKFNFSFSADFAAKSALHTALFFMAVMAVLCSFTTSGASEDPPYFLPGEFRATRKIVFKIMENFPPSKYFYIGLGRSLTAEIALLEVLKENKDIRQAGIRIEARNVPISLTMRGEFSQDENGTILSRPTTTHPEQTESSRKNIRDWLLSVVESCKASGLKALFMDFAFTGIGIGQIVELLGEPDPERPFEFLVLRGRAPFIRLLPRALTTSHVTVWEVGGPLGEGLSQNGWKYWSEYPQWLPEVAAHPTLTPLPRYAELKAYIVHRLEMEHTVGNEVRRLQRMCSASLAP